MSAGNVVNVQEVVAGSELVADVAVAATSITVEDPTDFQPDGGELLIGDLDLGQEEVAYSTVDEATGVIELDTPLVGSYSAEERVEVLPLTTERFAHVQLEDQDETLAARVPHSLYERLTVGVRDPNADELELVEVARDGSGELVVADVLEREPTIDGSYIDPGTIPVPDLTDGNAPATSPTPDVFGGVLSLFVSWVAVANADPVTYEVHVDDASGFTPGPATFVGEVRGTFFVVRHLPGTTDPPAYGTEYFVRLIAKDDDGAAAPGAEDSATPEEGMAEAIVADLIAANAILAEKLEAVLVLGSTIVAGALGAGRVELGVGTGDMEGMIGIHAVDEDGVTVNFMVDAETGEVYVRGTLDFGTASRLLANDIVELAQQPTGGFQTPTRAQRVSNRGNSGTASVPWQKPTTQGSLLLACLTMYDPDGSLPSPTTPAGWTLVRTATIASPNFTQRIYKIEDASARSGAQAFTLNDTVVWLLELLEYTGAEVEDVNAGATTAPASTTASSGTTAATTQAEAVAVAFFAALDPAGVPNFDTGTITAGWTPLAVNPNVVPPGVPVLRSLSAEKVLTATGAQGATVDLDAAAISVGNVLVFKAKAAVVDTPAAGLVRLYARDVGPRAAPHVMQEDGVEGALVLGEPGEVWQLELVIAAVDIPVTNGGTGGNLQVTIPGLAVGDWCIFAGVNNIPRGMALWTRGVCSTAGEITLDYFNTDNAQQLNPGSTNFAFLVIHRA